MNDEQRLLAAANNTILNGLIGTDRLINQMELLRILSLEAFPLETLLFQEFQRNPGLLARLCDHYGLDRVAELLVSPTQILPPRETEVWGVKRRLQTTLDQWEQFKQKLRL